MISSQNWRTSRCIETQRRLDEVIFTPGRVSLRSRSGCHEIVCLILKETKRNLPETNGEKGAENRPNPLQKMNFWSSNHSFSGATNVSFREGSSHVGNFSSHFFLSNNPLRSGLWRTRGCSLCATRRLAMGKEKNPVLLMEEIMHRYGEYIAGGNFLASNSSTVMSKNWQRWL